MKKMFLILFTVLGVCLSSFAHAQPRPEIAAYVKGYKGQEGIKVWTLRIGPTAKNEAIVQITGIDHPWDMRIQKMNMEPGQQGTNYVTTVDGKRFVALVMRGSSAQLYLPGSNDPKTSVSYSESLSKEGNAEYFLTDYLEQKNKQ